MKTVLQELIDIIKDKRKESDISNTLLRFCQVEAEKLLQKEKQQILNANDRGYKVGRKDIPETANDYYEDTFGDSNEAGI